MLCGLLARIRPARVLVIGDLLLDVYTHGKIERISPEAPVSILHVNKETSQPGGAGNVATNLRALGAKVVMVGRVGCDSHGESLIGLLKREGIETQLILKQGGYATPVKNRLMAEAQQLLRIDREEIVPLGDEDIERTLFECEKQMAHVDLVAISDYGKGFFTPQMMQRIIQLAKAAGRTIVIDPKGDDFSKYEGASVLKPNLQEAQRAAKLPIGSSMDAVAEALLSTCRVDTLLITRAGDGMSLFHKGGKRFDVPALSKEVKDVIGAGDTVLAMLCLALANGIDTVQAAHLANTAASIAIEHVGCAKVSLEDLAKRLLQHSMENKIFSEEHLFALEQVLRNKKCILLSVQTTEGITNALFRAVRTLSHQGDILIAYIRDAHPDPEYVAFLSSLSEVHFIILKNANVREFVYKISPQAAFSMEDGALLPLGTKEFSLFYG